MEEYTFAVSEEGEGNRLDRYLSEQIESLSRSYLQRLIADGLVRLNGEPTQARTLTKFGDEIKVFVPEPVALEVKAEDIPLDIVYEDEALLVVNKPQGMVVHPAAGNYTGTLVNALLFHCDGQLSGINGVARPGIVHRIDKDTSGLLVVAKTNEAHGALAEQIKVHDFTRVYHAIVCGNIKEDEGKIDLPVGRHPVERKKMCVNPENGRNAVTYFTVKERFGEYTYVTCKLETGRTHQIRVHMSHIGHPIIGDPVYGRKDSFGLKGQALHAAVLGFRHPMTQEYMEFSAPLPSYFEAVLEKLHNKFV